MAWYRPCISTLARFATRKAAAPATRLTLASNRKETKNFSMFSEVIRRNSSTLASVASEEIKKKEILKEETFKYKSLYLCFEETIGDGNRAQAIYSVRLSHLLAPQVHGAADLKLQKVAYRCGPSTIVPISANTGVVRSKINFCGGLVHTEELDTDSLILQRSQSKEVCVFETDPSIDPDSKLQPSQIFKISRADPILVEVGYKLYCISTSCDYGSFEVFEPMHDAWLPLAVPPRKYLRGYIHAIAGRKILLWGRDQTGVNMFDTIHPDKGWTELDSCVGDYIVSIDGYDQLFVEMKSRYGDGEGFLMFSINLKQPYKVLASYMSHTFDFLKPMDPLWLPVDRPPKLETPCRCLFFHLGCQKVGLVLSYDCLRDFDFVCHLDKENENGDEDNNVEINNEGHDDSEKVRVLVIVFEYEIEESMDIKYKLLCSRCLEYSTKNHGEESDFESDFSQLLDEDELVLLELEELLSFTRLSGAL